MHEKAKKCLFYLYTTAKNEIQICSNKHETGLILGLRAGLDIIVVKKANINGAVQTAFYIQMLKMTQKVTMPLFFSLIYFLINITKSGWGKMTPIIR